MRRICEITRELIWIMYIRAYFAKYLQLRFIKEIYRNL